MTDYQAPLADMRFLLREVFDAPSLWQQWPEMAERIDIETAEAILEEAGKLTAERVAPLNRNADEQGCRLQDGRVRTPDGFIEAWRAWAEGGWVGLGGDAEYGGMGMPKALSAQVEEMLNSACLAFSLYPMLTSGAALTIDTHGSDALRSIYLPPLYAGTWAGAMCLTEPQAGTDLGLIRTRAEPQVDGSYRITGTKIFITAGEHDLAENIIHLVLARLPDAPAGNRGISLFLVPKLLVSAEGGLGERNALSCGSLEHKMGISGSATCVINYDGATGYLLGEPNRGLAAMFTMMNYERLGVGIQGLAAGERSWQTAVAYASERLQSRAPGGAENPQGPADPILVHPDVRRMLLTMKALNEGGRAFSTYVALQLDIARHETDAGVRQKAEDLVALLTPVAKAFLTDMGLETTIHGQQVLGGHGYIREWGQEQLVRDCRITQIYEGTNGIQALDLLGRKVVGSDGRLYRVFADEIRAYLASGTPELAEFGTPLAEALDMLDEVTASIMQRAAADPREVGAACVEYLHLMGYTAYAYLWARMAGAALGASEQRLHTAKLATARFYFARVLPRIHGLRAALGAGSAPLFLLGAGEFLI